MGSKAECHQRGNMSHTVTGCDLHIATAVSS